MTLNLWSIAPWLLLLLHFATPVIIYNSDSYIIDGNLHIHGDLQITAPTVGGVRASVTLSNPELENRLKEAKKTRDFAVLEDFWFRSHTWRDLSSVWDLGVVPKRSYPYMFTFNGENYLIGGLGDDFNTAEDVFTFDGKKFVSIGSVASPPPIRAAFCVLKDHVVVLGGQVIVSGTLGHHAHASVFATDPLTWVTAVEVGSTPRYLLDANAVCHSESNTMYTVGGVDWIDQSTVLNHVDRFVIHGDPINGFTVTTTELPDAMVAHAGMYPAPATVAVLLPDADTIVYTTTNDFNSPTDYEFNSYTGLFESTDDGDVLGPAELFISSTYLVLGQFVYVFSGTETVGSAHQTDLYRITFRSDPAIGFTQEKLTPSNPEAYVPREGAGVLALPTDRSGFSEVMYFAGYDAPTSSYVHQWQSIILRSAAVL